MSDMDQIFRRNSYLSKRDLAVILIVLGMALALLGVWNMTHKNAGSEADISINGKVWRTVSLTEDQIIEIPGRNGGGKTTNVLEIRSGRAWMREADCPDKLCMHQGKISSDGQSIVCLPERVVVTVRSPHKSEIDTVVK